ncbi:unnamed protein product [Caenorhabditis angaria]|uniref:DH domain-containing protein n=1 Tax=Caenorhabditis angaria TaxID=860376 RepID=A0A9P1IEA6_9PELO|nr:unnamed protein product [Caenorhabditis angaria]
MEFASLKMYFDRKFQENRRPQIFLQNYIWQWIGLDIGKRQKRRKNNLIESASHPRSSSTSTQQFLSACIRRRPSLPAIPPPIIEEMSSSVGHARTRRPSLHPDWTTVAAHGTTLEQHQRNIMAAVDNRIHNIEIEPPLNYILANFKDIDNTLETIHFEFGQRLYEAFEPYLRARGLTINDIEFFLEKSSTPIPENSEARYLAGHKIFVRGRGTMMKVGRHTRAAHSMDESNERATRKMSAEAVSRKSSFVNSRILNRSRNHPNLNGSDDAECRSNDSSLSVRDISQFDEPSCSDIIDDGGTRRARSVASSRISLFFGKEKNDMINRLNSLKEEREAEFPHYRLEKDWREIVRDYQNLSEKAIKQQEAIWEIIATEHRYIKLLRYLVDLSFYLQHLQYAGYLKDIDHRLVFINFPQLLQVNVQGLWTLSIDPILSNSRSTGDPLDVRQLWNGFEEIGEWSKYYIAFNLSHTESHSYLQKKTKDHEQFREFVQWAESQENLDRQKLCDTLSQPMQRLTRYNLLLKALLKVTSQEDERKMLEDMIERSESATKQLNYEMNNNDLRLQLNDVMRSIEGYECVDSEELEKLFGYRIMLNLCECMPLLPHKAPTYRTIFHKGDVRMAESRKGSKIDVHCIVFTDMFLICRKIQGKKDRLKIIKPPIHIARIVFHPFPEANGFYVISMTEFRTPASLFMMYTSGIEETHRWTEMLKMAEDEYKRIYRGSWSQHDFDTPVDEFGRGFLGEPVGSAGYRAAGAGMPPGMANLSVSHRKCSSMDSQAVAAHAHLNYMHRSSVVSSTEQLDRHSGSTSDMSKNTPPRHKLSVASCIANPLSSSKSSVDLYVSMGNENELDDRPRSRSNSSGPDIEGIKPRSRSNSPAPKENGEDSPLNNTPCRDSPTLLITPDDSVEPQHSGRRFEKRYHTADGIDVLKPKSSMLPGAILKRFSWNVGSAVNGSSRKRLESSRRSSQASTAASMDSFGSSTSGISTSSSCNNENTSSTASHVSTIAINDTPTEPQSTLSINLENAPTVIEEDNDTPVEVPPIPELPPPSTTPSPNSTSSTKKHPKHQELLKFIMDNHLETSDV